MNGVGELREKRTSRREWREKLEIIITTIAVVVSRSSHIKVVIFFFLSISILGVESNFSCFHFILFCILSHRDLVYISGFNIVSLFLFSHPANIYPVKSEFIFSHSIFSFLRVVILIQFIAALASWLAFDSFSYTRICFFIIFILISSRELWNKPKRRKN